MKPTSGVLNIELMVWNMKAECVYHVTLFFRDVSRGLQHFCERKSDMPHSLETAFLHWLWKIMLLYSLNFSCLNNVERIPMTPPHTHTHTPTFSFFTLAHLLHLAVPLFISKSVSHPLFPQIHFSKFSLAPWPSSNPVCSHVPTPSLSSRRGILPLL